MARRFSALFLLSFLLLTVFGSGMVFGSDKPFTSSSLTKTRVAPAAIRYYRTDDPVNTVSGSGKSDVMSLNATAHEEHVVGFTTYDYQNNAVQRRQIEHRGTDNIHIAWMYNDVFDAGSDHRDLRYYAYNLTSCNYTAGQYGTLMGAGRAGYVSLDVYYPTDFPVPSAHVTVGTEVVPTAYYDYGWNSGVPLGLFQTDSPTDIFGWGAVGVQGTGPGNTNIWPYIEMDIGTETVLHMVCSESLPTGDTVSTLTTLSYYRRVGAYGYDAGGVSNGVWSDQRVIDSNNMGDPIVVQDPNSDEVALVWMAPCAFNRGVDESQAFDNDVYYAFSSNQGADWASKTFPSISDDVENGVLLGGNITNYANPGASENWHLKEFGFDDVQGLYDASGNLHVVWNTRLYASDNEHVTFRDGGIYHWSQNNPTVSTVYRWPLRYQTVGNACVTLPGFIQECGKLSLSMCDDGTLYVSFTKFGHDGLCDANECDGICTNADNGSPAGAQGPNAVGYMYNCASDDGGVLWDSPVRITGRVTTATTGCWPDTTEAAFQCHSEMWGSMARYSRIESCGDSAGIEVLDVVYIDDLAPGDVIVDGAVWSNNPVTWQVTSCRDVVKIPMYADDAGNGLGVCYGDNIIVVAENSDTTVTVHLTNEGLLANNYSTSIIYLDGSGWLGLSPASGTIGINNTDTVNLDFTFTAPSGAPNPSTWAATVTVTHDADNSPREIPVCMIVGDFQFPEYDTLGTACKQVRVYNHGQLANAISNEAMDYFVDCDTGSTQTDPTSYLYDASPIITRLEGTDTLRFMAYSKLFTDPDGLRPLSGLTVDRTTNAGSYSYASGMFTTADTSVSGIVEYYVPTASDTCEFIIQRLKFFSGNGSSLTGVLLGEIMDWDVPSDSGSRNTSSFAQNDNTIWMQGYEYDNLPNPGCSQLETDRYAGVKVLTDVKNAMTFDNATYIYTSGPYGLAAPLPPQVAYDKMSLNGFSIYNGTGDSIATDLSMLVTFGSYDIAVGDTIEAIMVLSTGKTGSADFQQSLADGKAWAIDHGLITGTCCDLPGDANNDGGTNVGDAVYIINFAFRGGPAPICEAEGDANADGGVNVGDAVYIINFAFRGGAAPICGPQ